MDAWGEYLLAWCCFLAAHVMPAAPGPRGWLVARIGRRGYLAAFSLLSLALLAWLIAAAGHAPHLPLWDAGAAGRWLVNLAMPVAILAGVLSAGLSGVIGGFAIWSAAHLLANGDLAHALLFGGMLGFALIGVWRRGWPRPVRPTAARLGLAALIWLGLLALHPAVIGVSPLPV